MTQPYLHVIQLNSLTVKRNKFEKKLTSDRFDLYFCLT